MRPTNEESSHLLTSMSKALCRRRWLRCLKDISMTLAYTELCFSLRLAWCSDTAGTTLVPLAACALYSTGKWWAVSLLSSLHSDSFSAPFPNRLVDSFSQSALRRCYLWSRLSTLRRLPEEC